MSKRMTSRPRRPVLAGVAAAGGQPEQAARLLGATQTLCEALVFPVLPHHGQHKRAIAATRAAYGVDNVEITDYSAKTTATAGQLRSDAEALPGIRKGFWLNVRVFVAAEVLVLIWAAAAP